MTTSVPYHAVLEAATVIRVPPPEHSHPYVIGAVRIQGHLRSALLDVPIDAVPAPGTELIEKSRPDGTRVYVPADVE